jgi:anthranilate synthase component 2
MHITVIDNFDSFVFNLVRYLREIPEVNVSVHRNDLEDLSTLEETDAILLSPGPGIPIEAGKLMEVIEQFHAKTPILGVCLGHQAIGEYFGAKMKQEDKPVHGKPDNIVIQDHSSIFQSLGHLETVGRYHSWSLTHLPKELSCTSQTQDGTIMSFKHETLPLEGVQFHPESILTPNGRKMITNWVQSIKS